MKISNRVKDIPYSAIRKLTPYRDEAIKKGKKVYQLNIGAPDTRTPQEYFDALKNLDFKTVEYAPSNGLEILRKATCDYYKKKDLNYDFEKEILITAGASEALTFAILAVSDIGDNILTTNPFYSNYNTMFKTAEIDMRTFETKLEDGFRIPSYEKIVEQIDDKTRAILLANPSNPTGAVYTEDEIRRIVRVAKEKDLYIIADEVYREFVFGEKEFFSIAQVEGIEDRLILLDSISKRFGACGARIGAILCKNQDLMAEFIKLATGRLAVATVEQIGAAKLYDVSNSYFEEVIDEYKERRDILIEGLKNIDGVEVYVPEGAFYVMPKLPIEDTEDFAKWLLTDYDYEGETVMLAPGSGFFEGDEQGKSVVRIAYVINKKDLKRSIEILDKALKVYKNK